MTDPCAVTLPVTEKFYRQARPRLSEYREK